MVALMFLLEMSRAKPLYGRPPPAPLARVKNAEMAHVDHAV